MAHFLASRSFRNVQEVEIGVREGFASNPAEWYRAGIENLAKRWQQCVDKEGIYFEC